VGGPFLDAVLEEMTKLDNLNGVNVQASRLLPWQADRCGGMQTEFSAHCRKSAADLSLSFPYAWQTVMSAYNGMRTAQTSQADANFPSTSPPGKRLPPASGALRRQLETNRKNHANCGNVSSMMDPVTVLKLLPHRFFKSSRWTGCWGRTGRNIKGAETSIMGLLRHYFNQIPLLITIKH
jgi:hypothetical protein